MKNTELIKIKNLLDYKNELEKVKKLEQDAYTTKEAAVFFGCATTQIKGYLTNYKEYFKGLTELVKDKGQQKILISKDAMFLLAILLDKKSTTAKQVTNAVKELIANESAKKKPKKDIEEDVQLEMDLDKVKIERLVIKNGKIAKEEGVEVSKKDLAKQDKIEDIIKALFDDKEEVNETNKEESTNVTEEELKRLQKEIKNRIEDIKQEIEEEEIDFLVSTANRSLFKLINNLKTNNAVLNNYMDKCRILGLEELESSILLQEAFILEKDPDEVILNALYQKEKEELSRKRGVLRESIELLASEKFNGEIQDTYHYLSNELRFFIGMNMKKIRDKQRFANINPTSYLDMIIRENAFDYTMDVIHTLLAE